MTSYFSISFCIGPFSNLTEEIICNSIDAVVRSYGPKEFESLWAEFSFGEDILEEAANEVGDELTFEQSSIWQDAIKSRIKNKLIQSANAVYLDESNEATQAILDGKSWIFSGGQTWDGYTTEIAEHIRFVRWSGLDKYLSTME